MKGLLSLLFVLLSCLAPGQVLGQGGANTLVERHYRDIVYVSGGVGEDELDEIRSRERRFNLKLLFAERGGAYIGDVDVVLINAAGDIVLDVQSVGPFLLVQLPGGNYEIRAAMNGQVQRGRLSINAKRRHDAVFRW